MNAKPCHFCSLQDQIRYETEYVVAILDKYPVTQYHTLIIPKRHIASFFSMTMEEHADCVSLLNVIKDTLSKLDSSITGFNIGVNDGNDAGQTVMHCHIHLIPRRKGDTDDPVGGLRNVMPGKGNYLNL
ncbi:MAG TPA: HIT family protein [Candidatus Nitrosotalea sp.]|nr:HIT family protein [Candidatus Nitrosotalea sp.]